jgi:aminoglycoside phosphotransferase family enzyme/predicted kinase
MTMPTVAQAEVLERMADPAWYPERPATVERIDTHTASVFLAGDRAYKVKRAVRYSFLDYSTLELRRRACEAEVRLNRRTAPRLYEGVTPVTREASGALTLNGRGDAMEWLVVMRRFPGDALLDRVATAGGFSRSLAVRLADAIADFHAPAVRAPHQGGPDGMRDVLADNARALGAAEALPADLVRGVTAACDEALERHAALIDARRGGGFVRQLHGDLHLRNIVLLDGTPTLFDGIEFNDAFSCIDVWYDLAFLLMDLLGRGLALESNLLFNHYLLRTGDIGGLPLLPLFLTTRAAVRAKTSLASAALEADPPQRRHFERRASDYLALADRCSREQRPRLIAIGGLSGSGKSTLAAQLAPLAGAGAGAVVLRSDVLRKVQLHHGLDERLGDEAYTDEVNAAVYRSIGVRAADVLASGGTVVADATFLAAAARDAIAGVAAHAGVPFTGVWLEAPVDTMAERLRARAGDASDATVDVLRQQLAEDQGSHHWLRFDSSRSLEDLAASIMKAGVTDRG